MCGICGFVGQPAEWDPSVPLAMRDVLRHRGPDGEGGLEISSGPLRGWLGHRRLKIVDLTPAAAQPMCNESGTVALTYNGEVYNFRELRRELEAEGFRFHSSGDTEVVLRAYEAWGENFVTRLDGMFAFALWDARTSRMILGRDRAGKKPLYYSLAGGRLTFGSEIKALLQAPWINASAHFERLGSFLAWGYVPEPDTLYAEIDQIPAASTLCYGLDGAHGPSRYWDPVPNRATQHDPDPAVIARLLDDATKRRLIADVPLGALLSGGIDSSLVVALMSRAAREPVRTFSIGFPDEQSWDERGWARMVAEHVGSRHTEFAVRADAVALLNRLIWHHDQPFADSSAIPSFIVSRLAREQVTVVLSGDGGDETFGGYDRFVGAAVARLIPTHVASVARRLLRVLPQGDTYAASAGRLARFFAAADQPLLERYRGWVALMSDELVYQTLAPPLRARLEPSSLARPMREADQRSSAAPELDRILYMNFVTYLQDDLLVKMDRMSMAHSLEARSPFLDTALIEYLSHVPARQKVGLRRLKPLLGKALGPLLPDAIWRRGKHGFGVPMGTWLRGELGTVFEDEVLAHDARTRDLLDRTTVTRLWSEQRARRADHAPKLWALLTVERWLREQGGLRSAEPPRPPVVEAA